jgi:predicted HicB family RNase H-like nuclease
MVSTLNYKDYKAEIRRDIKGFVATIFPPARVSIGERKIHGNSEKETEQKIYATVDAMVEESTRLRLKSKEFSGKLAFRTSPELHYEIAVTAEVAGKSLNRYIEDELRSAILKHAEQSGRGTHPLVEILLNDPQASSQLFMALSPHLDQTKIDIFRFAEIIKQFIEDLGKALDDIHPYLKTDAQNEARLICALGELLATIQNPSDA